MTQVSKYKPQKEVQERMYELFLDALGDIKNRNEARAFLEDFFTPTERIMFPKRLAIAFLLTRKVDQRLISERLKVSFTTITRISNILKTQGSWYRSFISKVAVDKKIASIVEKADDILELILNMSDRRYLDKKRWQKDKEEARRSLL